MSAAGEVIVVTGASSGIGLAVAQLYVARGDRVVMNGRDEAKLARAAASLGPRDRIATVPGDVGSFDLAERLVQTALDRFGRLDVVVANAGVFAMKPFDTFTPQDLASFVSTNLQGTVYLSQAAVRAWRARKAAGAIVSITASIALSPQRAFNATIPTAIKASINALTRALALELAPERIRVNAVAPGIIDTPLISDASSLSGAQPMGHVGKPSDVAEAVAYLAAAPFVTGVVLPVDGGMSAGRW